MLLSPRDDVIARAEPEPEFELQLVAYYGYDPFSRRILRNAGGLDRRYVYDGWREVEERVVSGTSTVGKLVTVRGEGLDEILTVYRLEGSSWVGRSAFQDHLGSVVELRDGSGNRVERVEYDPYGAASVFVGSSTTAQGMSSVENPWLFTGGRLDQETGLVYLRNRYMKVEWGRFATIDPIGEWGDSASLGNGYAYVGNAGSMGRDPFGLETGLFDSGGSGMDYGAGGQIQQPGSSEADPGVIYEQDPQKAPELCERRKSKSWVLLRIASLREQWEGFEVQKMVGEGVGQSDPYYVYAEYSDGQFDFAVTSEGGSVPEWTMPSWHGPGVEVVGYGPQGGGNGLGDYVGDALEALGATADAMAASGVPLLSGLGAAGGLGIDGARGVGLLSRACRGTATCVSDYERLLKHLAAAERQFAASGFTRRQGLRLSSSPNLRSAFQGERIDHFFRMSASADPELGHLSFTARGKFGPDVVDAVGGLWYDVTTTAQWERDMTRYAPAFGSNGQGLFYR